MSNSLPSIKRELSEISLGDKHSFRTSISEQDIDQFAKLSGDFNPLHMSSEFARRRGFRSRVVHGSYLNALVSRMVGMFLPGENALIQQMQLIFRTPVYAGDTVELSAVVSRLSESVNSMVVDIKISVLENQETNSPVAVGKVQIGFTSDKI